jgi:hypothetical protein
MNNTIALWGDTITQRRFDKLMDELSVEFSSLNLNGDIDVVICENRRLVTIKTKSMILETHKQDAYLNSAFLHCDNYSIKVENGYLVLAFGFIIK